MGSWAWEAASTLLIYVVSRFRGSDISFEGDKACFKKTPPSKLAILLKNAIDESGVRKQKPPLRGKKDDNIFNKLSRAMCSGMNFNTVNVGELVDQVANIIRNPGSCPTAYVPIVPLSIMKAEYYEFVRGYGGYYNWLARELVMVPAISQALALVGHVLTRISKNKHLLIKSTGKEVGEVYRGLKQTLSHYLAGKYSRPYSSVLNLLAAGRIAIQTEKIQVADSYAIATLQTGNTISVASVDRLPLGELVSKFNRIGRKSLKRFYYTYLSLATAASYQSRKYIIPPKGGRVNEIGSQLMSMLLEFSQSLEIMLLTGSLDYAYMSLRSVETLLGGNQLASTMICTSKCNEDSPEFSYIAELAVNLKEAVLSLIPYLKT